jgi:hypothetical protein
MKPSGKRKKSTKSPPTSEKGMKRNAISTDSWQSPFVGSSEEWMSFASRACSSQSAQMSGGLQPVRTVLRALVLRQLAEGQAIRKVARNVGLTSKTVWLTSQRYQQGGLEGALLVD